MHVRNVKVADNLVRQAVPHPILAKIALLLALGQFAFNVGRLVAGAVRAALELVERPPAGHANVDDGVNLVALVLGLPEGRVQLPHSLEGYSDRLWVHEDAHGWELGRAAAVAGHVGVLGSQGREMRREAAGDFPRGIDGVPVTEGL